MTRRTVQPRDVLVYHLSYTKADLLAVPADQRSFFILLGQISNEVTMLHGLLAQAMNATRAVQTRPEAEIALGQALMLLRLLAGKVLEGRNVLNAPQNARLISAVLKDQKLEGLQELRARAASAQRELNTYFQSKEDLITKVRNKLAFHSRQDALDEGLGLLPDDYRIGDFHTNIRGTTFYGTADTAAALAVAHLAGETDPRAAVNKLFNEVGRAESLLLDYAGAYLAAFSYVHFGPERMKQQPATRVKNAPSVETHRLHFYMSADPRFVARSASKDQAPGVPRPG